MGSKGSQTSTSTSAPNPQAMQLYQDLLTRAQGVANTPYTPYTGELVSPVNAQQTQGISNINSNWNYAQPFMQTAQGLAMQGASPITAADISQYMSPYTKNVVDATQAQFNNQNAQQLQQVKGNAITQGALGGNREAIAESELANQQNLAQAPVIAGLQNQGYQTGLSTALAEQQAKAQGAYSLGNLGVAGQSAALTGANAQVGAGTLQQGTQQALDQAQYQQYMQQMGYPFQTTQWLAGLGTGVGSQMGGTSSTTQPGPSMLGSIFGGLTSGLGMLGSSGAFPSAATATAAASPGWMAGLTSSLASAIPFFAAGGRVPEGVSNREFTIPETPESLRAQQHQLMRGHRKAQLFPHGTPELPVPAGMSRVDTEHGAVHYNPRHLRGEEVHAMANGGRLNDLLDLGPVTKDEALRRIHGGEHPVAVVERDHDGHEVRAALGTHLTALDQMTAMHKVKSPGHTVTLEHPDHVIAHRLRHHLGSGVANRDAGGGVNYQTFGGGFGTPVEPYGGGKGFVPGMGITRGGGPPRPPGMQQQQQSNLGDQMKNITGLAKSIYTGLNSGGLGDDGLGSTNDPTWTGGTPLAGGAPIGMGGIGSAKRGGGVSGYDTGGAPSFDDRFTGADADALPDTISGVPTQLNLGDGGFDPGTTGPSFKERFSGEPLPSRAVPPHPDVTRPSLASLGDTPPQSTNGLDYPNTFNEGDFPTPTLTGPKTNDGLKYPNTFAPSDVAPQGVAPAPTPVSTTSTGTAPASGHLPRGLRNNNPGNIEDGSFARSQPGYMGSDGRFAIFKTPEAGTLAQSNLLGAYGAKGINTLSGIINRWAPAADGNDVGAYVAAVSKELGISPDQQLNMADPALRQRIATAISHHENGTGGVSGSTLAARNYNRSAELSTDSAAIPSTNTPVQYQKPSGVANIDWGADSKLWPALMAAGFGMMSSRSPFAGVAIGEGGMQGLGAYMTERQQEIAQQSARSKLELESRKLSQEADIAQQKNKLAMMPYQGAMTAKDKIELATNQAKLEEARRQHDLALHTPVKWSEDRYGNVTYALPRPNPNGGIDYYPIDPNTREVSKVPAGSVANPLLQGNPPSNSTPSPGGTTSVATPPVQEGFTPVANMTLEQARDAAPPPEVRATMPAGSPQARNEAYLATIAKTNPQYAANLKAIADYQMNPAQLFSLRKNMRANAMGDLFVYDPTYDQRRYNSTNRAITNFSTGKQGDAVRSFSVAIEHLGTAEELGKALENGNIQALNSLRNTLKTQFGSAAVPNFDTAKAIVADEIAKAVIGGVNAERDRQGLQDSLKNSSSPAQLEGVIHTFKELMGGQVIGYKQQYESSTGLHNFDTMLTPRAKLEVSRIDAERTAKLRSQTLPGAPGTGTKPAAPAASTLPPGIPPGSVSGMKGGKPVWRTPDGQFIPKVQ